MSWCQRGLPVLYTASSPLAVAQRLFSSTWDSKGASCLLHSNPLGIVLAHNITVQEMKKRSKLAPLINFFCYRKDTYET